MEALIANDPGESIKSKTLTELCRIALDTYDDWVSAQTVRGYLEQAGLSLEYSNPMPILHTTLRRVGDAAKMPDGTTVYAKNRTALSKRSAVGIEPTEPAGSDQMSRKVK
jgi:hypothetical protein